MDRLCFIVGYILAILSGAPLPVAPKGRAKRRKASPWRPVMAMDGTPTVHEYRVKG